MTIICPQCQHKNHDDAEFCENCGAQLPAPSMVPPGAGGPGLANPNPSPAVSTLSAAPVGAGSATGAQDSLVCPSCKAPYAVGDVFCFNCGNDLSKLPGNQAAGKTGGPVPGPDSGVAAFSSPLSNNPLNQSPVVAAPSPAKNEMSADDWDKAFTNPAAASGPAPTSAPPVPLKIEPAGSFGAVSPASPGPAAAPGPVPAVSPGGEPNAFASPGPATSGPSSPAPSPSGPQSLVLQVIGPEGEEKVSYKGKEFLLGRQDAKTRVFPDVNLDDSAASRRHLALWQEDDGKYYAQDLESSNGTNLNGKDMEPGSPYLLNNGDIIKIGSRYSIQVRIS